MENVTAPFTDVYCDTDKGPVLWKQIAQDCFDVIERHRVDRKKAIIYDALMAAGVDNWDYYDEALESTW